MCWYASLYQMQCVSLSSRKLKTLIFIINYIKMSTEVGLSGIFQLWVVEGEMESRNVLVSNHALSRLSCPAPGG